MVVLLAGGKVTCVPSRLANRAFSCFVTRHTWKKQTHRKAVSCLGPQALRDKTADFLRGAFIPGPFETMKRISSAF